MSSSINIASWLVLGPIFNDSQQGSHYPEDNNPPANHPGAAAIIMDIGNNSGFTPQDVTRSPGKAPKDGDMVVYATPIFSGRSYLWRSLSFSNINWGNASELQDNIHQKLGIGQVSSDPNNPQSFAGKHHALVFFLVYIKSPSARTTTLFVESDDSLRVWLNGSEIDALRFAGDQDVNSTTRETSADISLRKGSNILLAAVAETHVEWAFSARIDNADGLEFSTENTIRSRPMTSLTFNYPVDIPWKLIATSPDMMDTTFGNKRFPYKWRSSLAISAYEPPLDDMVDELEDDRITYIKVTATLTGYIPSADEIKSGYVSFPEVPVEDLDRILQDYFACYGVLLEVGVFPRNESSQQAVALYDYPHIIDFEPKSRDLYQTASETGDILTGSMSKVSTGKSYTHADKTDMGFNVGSSYSSGETSPYGTFQGDWRITPSWGSSDQNTSSTQIDGSRERRETQSTTTQITQMYNLLTGYHMGTNRAAFVMLPRPHALQATDYRTFIKGLRMIEGIQEFFLVIAVHARWMD